MEILFICFIVICIIIGFLLYSGALFFSSGKYKWLFHDIFKWHMPDRNSIYRSDNDVYAKCKHCGKEIVQDRDDAMNWLLKERKD